MKYEIFAISSRTANQANGAYSVEFLPHALLCVTATLIDNPPDGVSSPPAVALAQSSNCTVLPGAASLDTIADTHRLQVDTT
jgi:hypothetical protein